MTTIRLDHVSRWYRNVVAVNDISMTIGPGVTGLLGPNGAGKSTLIALMSGFLAPSAGTVTLDGEPLWRNEQVYRTIGLVPEREALFDYLTGRQFVVANAELHGLPDPGAAAQAALALVEMTDAQDRTISTYSKGMRQRIKMASSLVHDPAVLLSDPSVRGARLRSEGGIELEASDYGRFSEVLPRLAREHGIRLLEVTPTDESLESVFAYLVSP